MGIIINNEFYSLEHEKNCSWLKKIEKKDDIFSFKTLLLVVLHQIKGLFIKLLI